MAGVRGQGAGARDETSTGLELMNLNPVTTILSAAI
jgi:hypothetical protein